MDKVKDILLENSIRESNISNNLLNEDTNTSDINSAFESMLSSLIETTIPKTIASSVCSVQPLVNGPDGFAYGVKRTVDPVTSEIKIKVKRQKAHANIVKRFTADFTSEFISDFGSFFDKIEADLFVQVASAESAQYVDSIIVPVLRNLATPMSPIVLNSEVQIGYDQMLHSVYEALVDINRNVKRGLSGFAILSPTLAGLFAQYGGNSNISNVIDSAKNNEHNIYYLGHSGTVDFYMDTLAPNDEIVVGYKSDIEGESALIYNPYIHTIYRTTSAEDSNEHYYSITRFGYTRNPLDNGNSNHDSDFLRVFSVDASNVGTKLNSALNNYQRDDFVATAGQTNFTVTGTGAVSRVFVNGVYVRDRDYIYNNPNVTLVNALNANDAVSIETFDYV